MTASVTAFDRAGVQLHVDDAGGVGLPVIFQHGLCGDARQTAEAFPPSQFYRRITLECRAHGSSESGDWNDFSLTRFTEDVAALITSMDVAPVIVGGISMGAAIALKLAITQPELVRGLILARPAWLTEAAPQNMLPNAQVGRLLATLPKEAARDAFLASAMGQRLARDAPDNLNSLVGFFERPHQAQTAALLQAIASDGPEVTRDQLRALDIPTLIIGTEDDLIHPIGYAKTLATLIPHARLAVITSKVVSRTQYIADFQHRLDDFLRGFV